MLGLLRRMSGTHYEEPALSPGSKALSARALRFRNTSGSRRPSAPKTLDLRDAAVAIGQFRRNELSRRREFQVRLRVVGNHAGIIPGITRRHFQNLVRHRGVDADARLADRAAIRHQLGVDEQPIVAVMSRIFADRGSALTFNAHKRRQTIEHF
jgi:hypothetical protein